MNGERSKPASACANGGDSGAAGLLPEFDPEHRWLRPRRLGRSRIPPLILLISGALAGSTMKPLSVEAATITVTTTADSGPGSLRAALLAAGSGDTINFSVTGAINLQSSLPAIASNVTIDGGALPPTIVGASFTPFFSINSGKTLALSNIPGGITNASGVTANGAFDLTSATATTSIVTLAGSGAVGLGPSGLAITAASTNFSGSIGGFGGVTINGGTQTFSASNEYFGGTTINGGVLEAAHSIVDGGHLYIDALGFGGVTFNGGELRVTAAAGASPTLLNDFAVSPGATGAIAAATGVDLSLQPSHFSIGANSVLQFGAPTDGGTVSFNPFNLAGPFSVNIDPTAAIVVAGGVLRSDADGFLDFVLSQTASTTVNAGATLDVSPDPFAVVHNLKGPGSVVTAPNISPGLLSLELLVDPGGSSKFSGVISGPGGVIVETTVFGPISGTMILSGDNTYTGGTQICFCSALQLGDGGHSGSVVGDIVNGGTLTFDRSDVYTFNGVISDEPGGPPSPGALVQAGPGTTILTAVNTYSGATDIRAGRLVVNGALTASAVTVENGGTLGGSGAIAQGVTVMSGGTLAPGNSPGAITVGSLVLNAGSILAYDLGAPNVIGGASNDLTNVTGALTLAGALKVTDSGGFGLGAYRLINYGGALTDNGLGVGSLPGSFAGVIQTAIPGQVNLIVSSPGALVQYFDGTTTTGDGVIHGGSGTWNNSATNWTAPNGAINASWQGGFGIFAGASGVATAVEPISFQGLQFSTNGYVVAATGTGALSPTGQASILVDSGVTATIAAPIGGAGGIVKGNPGALVLTGSNTYAGGTSLNAGTLGVGGNFALGTGALTIAGGATLQASAGNLTLANAVALTGDARIDTQSNAFALSGAIAGAGGLTKVGAGTLILSGASAYAGATAINAGVLQAGAVNALSPSSAFTIASGATLDLNGLNQTIGSLAGSGVVSNAGAGDATLTVGGDDTSTAFSGAIQDDGRTGLVKTGSGMLTLTADNNYSGATIVAGGALVVDGSIANSIATVRSGATLAGSGSVGGVVVQSGGALAPGLQTPFSKFHVVGDVAFLAGSTYLVNVAASGQTDSVAAKGKATLSGGAVQVVAGAGTYSSTMRYTLLTAQGGIAGAFASLTTTSNLAFLKPELSYDAKDVYLGFAATPAPFASAALTPNEAATATAVQALGPGSPVYNAVLGQSPAGARMAFDALSGEIHASAVSAAFDDSRLPREAVLDRLASPYGALGQGGAKGFAAANAVGPGSPSNVFAAWGQAFGSFGRIGGDGNAATLDRSLGGFILGLDASLDGRYRIGVAGGYTQSTLSLDARASSGRVDSTFAGLYGGASLNALQLRGGALYAYNRYATERAIAFPGFNDAASSGYGGNTLQAFGEAGWRFGLTGFGGPTFVEPFVGAMAMRIDTAGFAEAGGAAALTGASRGYDYGATTLGVRAETSLFAAMPLTARGMLGWRHAFGDVTPNSTLAFASAPSLPFAIAGAPIARDALALEAGLDWRLTPAATIGLFYSGALAARDQDNAVKGKFEVAF